MRYSGLDKALAQPETEVRLFGKPEVKGSRRLGVALARGESIQQARDKANAASAALKVDL